MQMLYSQFNKHRNRITVLTEALFTISMTVLIFISHSSSQDFVGTHLFKLFASLFMVFGLLSYSLKNQSGIQLWEDIVVRLFTILIPVIIIGKFTNVVDVSGVYPVIYLVVIITLHLFINRKSNWNIHGEIKKCSSREYLLEKYGRTVSIVPNTLMFIALLVPGVFNFPVWGFVTSLVVAFAIEHILVFILEVKYATSNHANQES
ncbi:hypothetical protein ACIQXI_21680 [Lysinibacillus sp. NPDC097195]|uniref:hypothetical protein n=1 Tax=Lysinibacillus sp. NPDC097195 TaxID=3364141 RepID=UPI00382B9937